jgi:hypothetical protein
LPTGKPTTSLDLSERPETAARKLYMSSLIDLTTSSSSVQGRKADLSARRFAQCEFKGGLFRLRSRDINRDARTVPDLIMTLLLDLQVAHDLQGTLAVTFWAERIHGRLYRVLLSGEVERSLTVSRWK